MAVKFLEKAKIANNETRTRQLISEIRVHWALESCDGITKLLEIFEDEAYVFMVLEYQKQGTLLQ